MAKPKISTQQKRRIAARRKAHLQDVDVAEGEGLRGTVSSRYGQQVDVMGTDGNTTRCHLRSGLGDLVTGDEVIWQDTGSGAVVVATEPRRTVIYRKVSHGPPKPLAANLDSLAVVVATSPPFHENLIDRYLIAAHDAAIEPLLVLNKCELAGTREALDSLARYRELGYTLVVCSSESGEGLDTLAKALSGQCAALVGQSGVGKSSLLNRLVPDAEERVGSLSHAADKGRHTTTHSSRYPLPGGGALIDSPGIREFTLAIDEPERIAQGFIEFRPFLGNCRFRDCRHDDDPGCALRAAVDDGRISQKRWESFHRILTELGD